MLKKLMAFVLALVLSLGMLTACGQDKSGTDVSKNTSSDQETLESKGQSITFTDMKGREITLEEPATKVVILSVADCQILKAIGAEGTLVGCGSYCTQSLDWAADIPSVESGFETNIEQIIALAPQVVITSTMNQTVEQVEQLEQAGITVVVSEAFDIEGVYSAVRNVGAVVGRDKEAQEVIDGMKSSFEELKARAEEAKKAKNLEADETVYFEVSPLEYGLWTSGTGTFMNELCQMLGVKNCFEDVDGYAEISEETVLERDPDYIVTLTMYYGEGMTPEEELLARESWQDVTAVKNAAIINPQHDELSNPSPILVDGANLLYEMIYGE